MSKVFKFGGSTIRCASTLKCISDIIIKTKDLRFIVLSATYNTTNALEKISLEHDSDTVGSLIENLFDQHLAWAEELGILAQASLNISSLKSELYHYLKDETSLKRMDSIYSIGERLSTILLYFLLEKSGHRVHLLDAREVIKTDSDFSQASPLLFDISKSIDLLDQKNTYITQGFIGSNIKGETTTIGREGSDYSAALLAWAIDATSMTVWKDVAGIYQTDPKVYKDVKLLSKLSYKQAQDLTSHGAKVLFSRTMSPLEEKNIKLYVRGLNMEDTGTLISKEAGPFSALAYEGNKISVLGENFFDEVESTKLQDLLQKNSFNFEKNEHSLNIISFLVKKPDLEKIVNLFAQYLFGR